MRRVTKTPRARADLVETAAYIGEHSEDGMLRSLLTGTREYALLVEGETDYHTGKEGRAEWSALGSVVAESAGEGKGSAFTVSLPRRQSKG